MTFSYKKNGKPYPPSNVSSHYYTDPVYSSDGFYGYEVAGNDIDEGIHELTDSDNNIEALDEPVESWGWINNADSRQFKQ